MLRKRLVTVLANINLHTVMKQTTELVRSIHLKLSESSYLKKTNLLASQAKYDDNG